MLMEKLFLAIGKIAHPITAIVAISAMAIGAVVEIDKRQKTVTNEKVKTENSFDFDSVRI